MKFIIENQNILLGFIFSFVITLISIPSIVKASHLKHLFDEPDDRSSHSHKTPTLGGLAIFSGTSIAALLFVDTQAMPELKYIIAAIIVMFFIGIKDDIIVIAPLTKLAGQIVASLIIIFFADIQITHLHGIFGIEEIPKLLGIPLSIFVVIVIINGFNLIDGIDGLSSGISALVATTFGIWFYSVGAIGFATLAFVITGAMLAFIRFNVFSVKNKIFMGDTGSLISGLLISVLVIKFNEMNIEHNFKHAIWGTPAVSFAILIIPLFDTVRVMFIRFFSRQPIFRPDKQHIHHVFLALGFSHRQSVVILISINIIFASLAFYCHNYFGVLRLLLYIVLAAMTIFYIPSYFINRKKQNETKK